MPAPPTTGASITIKNGGAFRDRAMRWAPRAAAVIFFGVALVCAAPLFGPDTDLGDGRALWLAAGLVFAGFVYCLDLPRLIRATEADASKVRALLWLIFAAGLAARALQFAGDPIIEDDYHRYLWDGAVAAHGLNPYAAPPADALAAPQDTAVRRLADEGSGTAESVNHSYLKTIYPPVAQAAFAFAHVIAPWSLSGWRLVCLGGELATFALLLALLAAAGRSPLWAAVYWWNPLVIKELTNSAHMEAVVTPLVLASLFLSAKRRPMAALTMLGLAAGAKLWPIILAPLVLRSLAHAPRRFLLAAFLLAALVLILSLPVFLGGLDQTSGFVVYAQAWKTNSALFPALENIVSAVFAGLGFAAPAAGLATRGILAVLTGALALAMARAPIEGAQDLMRRSAAIVAALVLLSPAQFPWYMAWLIPFLAFFPVRGLLATTALAPVYYAAFHFHAIDAYPIFRDWVVWAIWLPVWLLIAADVRNGRLRRGPQA